MPRRIFINADISARPTSFRQFLRPSDHPLVCNAKPTHGRPGSIANILRALVLGPKMRKAPYLSHHALSTSTRHPYSLWSPSSSFPSLSTPLLPWSMYPSSLTRITWDPPFHLGSAHGSVKKTNKENKLRANQIKLSSPCLLISKAWQTAVIHVAEI